MNIRFGTFYLRGLLNEFDNNLLLALASYNAGNFNVKKWKIDEIDDIDIQIEKIRFGETRNYVKRIFASMFLYNNNIK